MTALEFRSLALELPEAVESAHMGHPDFRVGGKIFATLGPGDAWGMVKLTPEQQQTQVAAAPHAFEPCAGAWGRRGATKINLEAAVPTLVQQALLKAWVNAAPDRLTGTNPVSPRAAGSFKSNPRARRPRSSTRGKGK
jgi:hypothetical protein